VVVVVVVVVVVAVVSCQYKQSCTRRLKSSGP
jgi:hypothetical protein